MTINFPKFPNDRRDKTLSPNPSLPDTTGETLPTESDETQAHNRSHQEMLKQTEYLDDVQIAEIKAQLIATPKKTQKKLPLVPFFIGLLLLIGGGAMGYMYQEYNRPTPPAATAQVTPIATPVTPSTPSTSAVTVTTTAATSSVTVAPTPAPVTASTSIMNANTPRANPPASAAADNKIIAVPLSTSAQTMPPSNNSTNPVNTPPIVDITNNPPANAPSANTSPPVNNSNPAQTPSSMPTETATNNASQSLRKSQASYDEFVKRSESTIYIDHAPIKK